MEKGRGIAKYQCASYSNLVNSFRRKCSGRMAVGHPHRVVHGEIAGGQRCAGIGNGSTATATLMANRIESNRTEPNRTEPNHERISRLTYLSISEARHHPLCTAPAAALHTKEALCGPAVPPANHQAGEFQRTDRPKSTRSGVTPPNM